MCYILTFYCNALPELVKWKPGLSAAKQKVSEHFRAFRWGWARCPAPERRDNAPPSPAPATGPNQVDSAPSHTSAAAPQANRRPAPGLLLYPPPSGFPGSTWSGRPPSGASGPDPSPLRTVLCRKSAAPALVPPAGTGHGYAPPSFPGSFPYGPCLLLPLSPGAAGCTCANHSSARLHHLPGKSYAQHLAERPVLRYNGWDHERREGAHG